MPHPGPPQRSYGSPGAPSPWPPRTPPRQLAARRPRRGAATCISGPGLLYQVALYTLNCIYVNTSFYQNPGPGGAVSRAISQLPKPAD